MHRRTMENSTSGTMHQSFNWQLISEKETCSWVKRGKGDDAQVPYPEVAYIPHFSICRRSNLAPELTCIFQFCENFNSKMTTAVCMVKKKKKKSVLTSKLKLANLLLSKTLKTIPLQSLFQKAERLIATSFKLPSPYFLL